MAPQNTVAGWLAGRQLWLWHVVQWRAHRINFRWCTGPSTTIQPVTLTIGFKWSLSFYFTLSCIIFYMSGLSTLPRPSIHPSAAAAVDWWWAQYVVMVNGQVLCSSWTTTTVDLMVMMPQLGGSNNNTFNFDSINDSSNVQNHHQRQRWRQFSSARSELPVNI